MATAREILARNMKMLRNVMDWSMTDLGNECGLHRTYIWAIEKKRQNISVDNLEKVSRAFGITISDLFADADFDDTLHKIFVKLRVDSRGVGYGRYEK